MIEEENKNRVLGLEQTYYRVHILSVPGDPRTPFLLRKNLLVLGS